MTNFDQMGLAATVLGILFLIAAFRKSRRNLTLDHFTTFPDADLPSLSVVVAAKDEEDSISQALDSLLSLDYPDLEIILVEDRSTDRTLELAQAKAESHPQGERLKIFSCRELPAGWLGKVHALHLGAKMSSKELVLFTDADVVFQPGSLKRAISAQQVLDCDHFVVPPQIEARGFWEPVLVSYFLILFAMRFQPTDVHLKKKRYVGVGAFNLLTREALERCDFLEPLKLQIIDDVHLGRLVKSRGLSQFCAVAEDKISVRWFKGLSGLIKGLEKNSYAGMEYHLGWTVFGLLFVATPLLLPISLFAVGKCFWASMYLLFLFVLGLSIPKSCRLPRWVGLTFPLASLVVTYTFLRAVILAEVRGGISWRDTSYPLDDLRREHHRFLDEVAPL